MRCRSPARYRIPQGAAWFLAMAAIAKPARAETFAKFHEGVRDLVRWYVRETERFQAW